MAAARAVKLVRQSMVDTVDGGAITVAAGSLCVHGDGSRATAVLRAVRKRFADEGIAVAPFAR